MKAVPWEIVSRRCLRRRLEVDVSGSDDFSRENETGLKYLEGWFSRETESLLIICSPVHRQGGGRSCAEDAEVNSWSSIPCNMPGGTRNLSSLPTTQLVNYTCTGFSERMDGSFLKKKKKSIP